MRRTALLWILAFLLTLGSAVWQRLTGPTHPVRVRETLAGTTISGRLLRTHETGRDLPVSLEVGEESMLTGRIVWRLFPGDRPWREVPLVRNGAHLEGSIPTQPSAGKVEYRVELTAPGGAMLVIPAGPTAVARFKGAVSSAVLAPHILLMFCGMLWSTRAGIEALTGGPRLTRQSWTTLVLLALGGLLLGPIVQKQAFGAYWTGWPLGEDLTDNKLAVAVLSWLVAAWRASAGRGGRIAAVVAALVTLAVYAIPHSMHGSTLDYETMETISG